MTPRQFPLPASLTYLVTGLLANLAWETAQIPLYTIWRTGSRREIGFAILHCTGGDALIAGGTLALGLLAARSAGWPLFGARMATVVIMGGLAYTVFSEWFNVEIRRSWTYATAMPVLPPFGTGLAPVLQWLTVPALAFLAARRHLTRDGR